MYGQKYSNLKKLVLYAIVFTYLVFVLFPLIWLVQSSFKSMYQALKIPPALIWRPTFEAYQKALGGGMLKAFLNSAIVSLSNVVMVLVLGVSAGYALANLKTKASQNIGFWILTVRMAPAFGIIVPLYIILRSFRLVDTIFAVMVAHLTINLPLAIWLLKSYFEEIPSGLAEAAIVDGATRTQILLYVLVPVAAPMIVAVSALVFLLSWNEFLFAFVLTSEAARTVPVLVASLAGTMRFDWPLMCALSTLALIPAFVLVVYLQRYIVRGLTFGAVK